MLLRDRNLVPEKKRPVSKIAVLSAAGAAIVLAVIARFILHAFWIFPLRIESTAMEPAVPYSTVVYVNRRSTLQFGDVVVYKHPSSGLHLLGRVIGLSGNRISMKDRTLTRDGNPITDSWETKVQQQPRSFRAPLPGGIFPRDNIDFEPVPKDHFCILADRREGSLDSRLLGFIPASLIVGKILISGNQ